jgi:two-component system, response regulator PdtaR
MIRAATAVPTLRLVIATADPALERLLKDGLARPGGHQLVGEARTGTGLMRTALALEPDVILFDLHLPRCNGLDALRQIYRERPVAAVALAPADDHETVRQALPDFSLAYLLKPIAPHQLEPAILAAWARYEACRQLAHENAALRQTLENRKVIERAKGFLMKRFRWTEADAYRRLQRGAMNRRSTMASLAQAVLNGNIVDL